MERDRNRVCPVELADSLDSRVRRWLQNPAKILAPFVREGMTAVDVGCGPGFFSLEMARMVGPGGKVVAADLQEGMLDRLREKIRGTALEARILTVRCDREALNVQASADFLLAFYMVHEVPDKDSFFRQVKDLLNNRGTMLLVEPKLFHVSREAFAVTTGIAEKCGFAVAQGPRLPLSWTAVLTHGEGSRGEERRNDPPSREDGSS
jgi:ubiquinone/menaquinone biosynthesis C-methylase UbiE